MCHATMPKEAMEVANNNANNQSQDVIKPSSSPSPSSSSPVRKIDPVVRAINTTMYGLVVHFGTLWMIELSQHHTTHHDHATSTGTTDSIDTAAQLYPGHLLVILFLHEYWVYLQHTNVLANPLLQHLDRQYGIALLKSNKHWSIAGTLSAYWARETLGMFLCLPFLVVQSQYQHGRGEFSTTQYMILYSLIYHTIKSRGVRQDALTRSSSKFGIMRLVIDKFYTHSSSEVMVTLLRLALQGVDTFIHYCIVRDLVISSSSSRESYNWFVNSMHILFTVWVLHAALNQLFRCSTASLMVTTWHSLTGKGGSAKAEGGTDRSIQKQNSFDSTSTEGESVSSNSDTSTLSDIRQDDGNCTSQNKSEIKDNDDFIVRQLLHHKRVQDNLKGRHGTASNGVDKAVRLETAITIVSSFFMIGLGEVPLKALSTTMMNDSCIDLLGSSTHNRQRIISLSLYAWLLWSLLHGIAAMFLKSKSLQRSMKTMQLRHTSLAINRRRSLVHMIDLAVMIGVATYIVQPEDKLMILAICAFLNGKVFMKSLQNEFPKLIWKSLMVLEFISKLAILRMVSESFAADDNFTIISSALSIIWAVWVVSSSVPTPCECLNLQSGVADVVFLGHPALLSDCWALWLLPYSLEERWQAPIWTVLLWPVHYLVGLYVCKYRAKLFGDGASFFCCDDNYYGQTRMQNWVASHFGRHFVTHPRHVKDNIEAAARHAEQIGVRVLCLGALNKAESINGGGLGIAKALGPKRRLSVIHGNHLTAAAVVETIHQCFGDGKEKLFLTGASSKVGWAVAQALRDRYGYDILCHSTDPGRRKHFERNGFAAASKLSEGAAYSKFWIVGKYDTQVAKLIPQNATACVFSVPHPLESRPDVRVIEAGTLHMDLSQLDRPRVFTNKLKEYEIFACHAASVVACYRLEHCGVTRIDEVGPVDPNEMDSWLDDAKRLGFSIPQYEPVLETLSNALPDNKPPVVIVGAGPSGLCVASYLNQKQIPYVLLEANEDPNMFGSWGQHFSGLEITTQKKWCSLPGLPMSDSDFPNETVTAEEYQQYLKHYVNRYDINIRRGVRVKSVEKGTELTPYIVKYYSSDGGDDEVTELAAWSVVDATGKHRIAQKNTSDDIVGKLDECEIPYVHSTEMCDDTKWKQAIEAAQNGRLCVVGLGNSASDLITMILQQCNSKSNMRSEPAIHVAARTIPPVFPRRAKLLRVDTLGYFMRLLPYILQDLLVKMLWWFIPGSKICNAAFPSHLKRWNKIHGRVPVIDKFGVLAEGFQLGKLVGHGPILDISKGKEVRFHDQPLADNIAVTSALSGVKIDMVILATGYREGCVIEREDRLNGLYKCGFVCDRFLPLKSIGEDAKAIADDIAASY